jgi:RNA polymerase-binding transcription factor DksA
MSSHDTLRGQLRKRLDQLLRRTTKIEADLRTAHDRDWEERASEIENDEVLEGLDAMSLAEVREIREALRRIDGGTYGVCSICGQSITAARLAANPVTVTCARCAV